MTAPISPPPAAVAIIGPTASGKTPLAIRLAQYLDTEIISADSMQVYKGMEIGTSAPSPEDRSLVVHHFVSFLDPHEQFSAGAFGKEARNLIARLNERNRVAVIVGGSGLYVRAVIDGLFPGPAKDQQIREQLHHEAEQVGVTALYQRLQQVDPDYAHTILPNDLRRIVRALEVYAITGEPISSLHRKQPEAVQPISCLQIGLHLPRQVLYERINQRVEKMLALGFLEEVRHLINHGYLPRLRQLRALGYCEFADYLEGKCTYEEALQTMQRNTRHYARRQLIWFRKDKRIRWLQLTPDMSLEEITQEAIRLIIEYKQSLTGVSE